MAYSAEVIRRARQRLSSAREDHASQLQQALLEAYEKVPRIQQIDKALRRSMALAAQAAFTQGMSAMEQAREQNQALQQERQALIAAHFPEGFPEETPICTRCGGEGYMGTQMCACLQELCRQEQVKELSLLSCGEGSFDAFRLDYYPDTVDRSIGASPRKLMERNFAVCKRYAENFPKSGNLLFIGGTGLGKTYLSACIAREVAGSGFSVCYESAGNLFAKLERSRFDPTPESREQAQRLEDCELLIVDDLGTELPGNFVTSALYTLLNDRLLHGKPMVISTNLNVDELNRRYSPQIASRLEGSFQRLTFLGQDIRVLRNRGKL